MNARMCVLQRAHALICSSSTMCERDRERERELEGGRTHTHWYVYIRAWVVIA